MNDVWRAVEAIDGSLATAESKVLLTYGGGRATNKIAAEATLERLGSTTRFRLFCRPLDGTSIVEIPLDADAWTVSKPTYHVTQNGGGMHAMQAQVELQGSQSLKHLAMLFPLKKGNRSRAKNFHSALVFADQSRRGSC